MHLKRGNYTWYIQMKIYTKTSCQKSVYKEMTESFSEGQIVSLKQWILWICSNALDRIFYPLWNELAKGYPSLSYEPILDGSQIEGLQRLLYYKAQHAMPLKNFVEKLCGEMESFSRVINKHLTFLETEVNYFSVIVLSQQEDSKISRFCVQLSS